MKKLAFSDKLAILVIAIWVFSAIATFVLLWHGRNAGDVFSTISGSFAVVLSAYLGKSGFENVNKIIQSDRYGIPKNAAPEDRY